jgi:hypothetical protein
MVDPEDVEGLTRSVLDALGDPYRSASIVQSARMTAEQHSYDRQLPLWREFFQGFVRIGSAERAHA